MAEWREVAEAANERLGGGPAEVRVSTILRIERLRSLREADERRRVEPDPLVEPAEAGVAAALRDAVAAANLYIETNPYLAEQQRRRQLRQCARRTVIGLFKTEVIRRLGPWRSLQAVEIVNGLGRLVQQPRLLGSVGNIPPAEAEANYHAALEATPMAAWNSNKPASEKPRADQPLAEARLESRVRSAD